MLKNGLDGLRDSRVRENVLLTLMFGLILVGTAAALFFVLQTPPVLTLDLGHPHDTRFIARFFKPEYGDGATFRRTSTNSRLMLHGTQIGPQFIDLRLHGHASSHADNLTLHMERAETNVANPAVAPGWRVYHVFLPPMADRAEVEPMVVFATSDRTDANDQRGPGVAIDWVRVVPGSASTIIPAAVLKQALFLTWAIAVVAVVGAMLCVVVTRSGRGRLRWALVLSSIISLGAVWWTHRDPYSVAWAVPAMPWLLGGITLLVLVAIARQPRPKRLIEHALVNPTLVSRMQWTGLLLLIVAQAILVLVQGVGAGIALALLGLTLFFAGSRSPGVMLQSAAASADDQSSSRRQHIRMRRWWPWLLLLLVAALALRVYRLDSLPYGLWRDEARHGLVALHMLEDASYRPIYVPEADLPAFALYPFVVAIKWWGVNAWSIRLSTALAGTLTVLPLYALVTQLVRHRPLALLSAALLGVSAWHISISRLAFATVFDPLLGLTGLWLVLVGLEPQEARSSDSIAPSRRMSMLFMPGVLCLAGVCFGLALQTYHTGRVTLLLACLLVLLLLLRHPRQSRRWLGGMIRLGGGFLLVTTPLLVYTMQHADLFNNRLNEVSLFSEVNLKARAPLAVLDETLGRHLIMFNVRGDNNGRHYAPNHPMLDAVTGLGFLVGIGALLRSWRHWRSRFLLGGLMLSVLPSMLAVDGPHATRSISAAIFACIIAAVGWVEVWRFAQANRPRIAAHTSLPWLRYIGSAGQPTVAAGLLIALALVLNYSTYFVTMSTERSAWGAFYVTQTQIGRYLQTLAAENKSGRISNVYVSSGVAEHEVTRYLTHGLLFHRFHDQQLSTPLETDALFVLSGYTYQQEVEKLAPYLGTNPAPLLHGPPLPDGKTPSFVVYRSQ